MSSADNIARTILEMGQIRAQGLERSAEAQARAQAASGQIWGGALAQLGQLPGEIMKYKLADTEMKNRQAELWMRQQEFNQRQQQIAVNQQIPKLMQQFTVDGPDGTKIVDRDKLRDAFSHAGVPVSAQSQAFDFLDGIDASTKKFRESQIDAAADQADHLIKFGATPQAVLSAVHLNVANGVMTQEQADPLLQMVEQGQDITPVLQQIRGLSKKYQEDPLAKAKLTTEQLQADKLRAEIPGLTAKSEQEQKVTAGMKDGRTAAQIADDERQQATQQAAIEARLAEEARQRERDAAIDRHNRVMENRPVGGGGGQAGAVAMTPETIEEMAARVRIKGPSAIPTRFGDNDKKLILNAASAQRTKLGLTPAEQFQREAAISGDEKSLANMKKMADAAYASEVKANAQADLVADLSNKVPRTQYPVWNRWLNSGKKDILGDQNTTLLFNALDSFTSEYAKIISGATGSVAAAPEGATRKAEGLISAALNKGTLAATVKQMQWEMDQTQKGYNATIDMINERALSGMGAPAGAQSPPTGQAPAAPAGWKYVPKAGGGWTAVPAQ